MSKIKTNTNLEIVPGDSVLVIGADGSLKKLIMPEFQGKLDESAGKERVLEILQLFNPKARLEVLEHFDRKTYN